MDQSNVVEFKNPAGIEDPVTEVLRQGARKLLAQAIEAEVEAFLKEHSGLTVGRSPQGCSQRLPAGAWDTDRHWSGVGTHASGSG